MPTSINGRPIAFMFALACIAAGLIGCNNAAAPAAAKQRQQRTPAMQVGLVWDDRFLLHVADKPDHPESPARLTAIRRGLEDAGLWPQLVPIPVRPAAEADILRVHSRDHLRRVLACATADGVTWFDPDTYAVPASVDAALLAAGGVCAAVDAVMAGQVRTAFCAVRPPGHHATHDRAMGFCLLNNVAIAARYAQAAHKVGRILIVDWDVHHGNGTQDAFWRDGEVMYVSLHQSPLYPHTGAADEKGEGRGYGHIRNYPLRPKSGRAEFFAALDGALAAAEAFCPRLIFISCGFDAHEADPLADLRLTTEDYAEATRRVRRLADRTAGGRVISVLEGGYDLEAIGRAAAAHVAALGAIGV